jgi:hypothetical protein
VPVSFCPAAHTDARATEQRRIATKAETFLIIPSSVSKEFSKNNNQAKSTIQPNYWQSAMKPHLAGAILAWNIAVVKHKQTYINPTNVDILLF